MADNQTDDSNFLTKLKPLYVAMLSSLLFTNSQLVTADTWNVGTSNWFTDGNWADGTAPTATDSVFINNGGTAQIGAAGALSDRLILGNNVADTGSISITAGGTLTSTGTSSIALGNIGAGNITVSGAGASWIASSTSSVVLGNTGTGTGTLNINSGGAASLTVTGTNDIQIGRLGTGTVTVDGTGSSLTISTQDEFLVSNPSTFTISNAATVTSNTTLGLSGTLNIGNGAAAGVFNISEVNGTGTTHILNFNQTDANYFFTKDGTTGGGSILISGSTIVNKLGTGKTTLTANNTYTGITTVNAGTLSVNGSIASSTTTVNAGGTLGGTGTVGTVNINGGTFAPGNSIGTTNVTGNVDFTGSGNYNVEVDVAGNSDKIIATGSATLTSGIVNVQPESGSYLANTNYNYTILTAGSLIGQFASVNSNLAFLTPTLTYDATNVFLKLTRNSVSFSSVANTPNQKAVSAILSSNSTALKTIVNNVLTLSNTAAQQAFDSLTGVQHTHGQVVVNQLGQQFQQQLFNRSSQSANGTLAFTSFNPMQGYLMADNTDNWQTSDTDTSSLVASQRGWWMQGFGGFGEIDDTTNASGAEYQSGGFAFGLDTDWRNLIVGVAGSYAKSNVDSFAGDSDIDSFQAATYASWQRNDTYINTTVGLGLHKVDATRRVTLGTSVSTASSDYDSVNVSTAIEAGKGIKLNLNTTLTPYVGVEYRHGTRDNFTETGAGTANLSVSEQDDDSLRTTLGLRLSRDITTQKGNRITPSAMIAYIHEHLDSTSRLEAGFSAVPTSTFRIDGSGLDRDRLQVGFGVTGQLNENTTLNVGYNGELAGSDDNHSFAATVSFVW